MENWNKVLNSNAINVLWSIDSIFAKNAPIFKECQKYPNFIAFGVAPADYEAAKYYMPQLKFMYMPHTTDEDLWKKKEYKKENDIVLFASVYDYEAKIEGLKSSKNANILYPLVNEFVEIVSKKPNSSFWELYNLVKDYSKFELNLNDYANLYDFVTIVVEQKQKIQMIQNLSRLNVKIFGNELWKKYIKENIQYMGSADLYESIDIMNKSKISLHCHSPQLNFGLHERFLNASSVGIFSLTSLTPSIKDIFQENFGYFNHVTFDDIDEKAKYYLEHDDEREQKAQNAMDIVHKNHLWKNRAIAIHELFS